MPSIELTQSDALRAFLASGGSLIRAAVRDGLNQAGMDLERLVKQAAPVKTGTLRRSIRYVMPDDLSVKVGVGFAEGGRPLVYAAQVEFGGPIPKNGPMPKGKFLAWPAAGNPNITPAGVAGFGRSTPGASGSFIFAKRVVQKGRPYLFPTVEAAMPRVVEAVAESLTKAMGGAGG